MKREAPIPAWSYYFDDHISDLEEYAVIYAFVRYVAEEYRTELKQILYPLFRCIILFNEMADKERKQKFFEKFAPLIMTDTNEQELRILRQYVTGIALGIFKTTLDQWKSDSFVITLSSSALTLLKNVLEGEVLKGMQDYLISKCRIVAAERNAEDHPLFQLRRIAKRSAGLPSPRSDVQRRLDGLLRSIPQHRRLLRLRLSQFISSSSLSFPPAANESHIVCSAVGKDCAVVVASPSPHAQIAVATDDSRIHLLTKDAHAAEDSLAYEHTLLIGHSASVTSMCFSCDGDFLVSAGIDGAVRLWSTKRRCCACCYAFTALPLWTVQLNHHNDRFVCGGLGCTALLCDTAVTTAPDRIITGFRTDVSQFLFSPNDRYVFAAEERGVVQLVNTNTGSWDALSFTRRQCERLYDVGAKVRKMLLCGEYLVVGDENGRISAFDGKTAVLCASLVVDSSPVTGLVPHDESAFMVSWERGRLMTLKISKEESSKSGCAIGVVEECDVENPIHDAFSCGMNTTVLVEYDS